MYYDMRNLIRITVALIGSYGIIITPSDNLLHAVRDGKTGTIAYLLEKSISQKNLNNALHIAAYYNQPDITDILLAHGANPDTHSSIKDDTVTGTALHTAIYANAIAAARVILSHGIDPNQHMARIGGSTPLHVTSSMETVHLLIQHHADTTKTDDTIFHNEFIPAIQARAPGKTPLDRLFEKTYQVPDKKSRMHINMISIFLGYNAKVAPLYQRVHAHAENQRSIEIDRILEGNISHMQNITPMQAIHICIGTKYNENVISLLEQHQIKPKVYTLCLSDCALFNNMSLLSRIASTYPIPAQHLAQAFERTARLGDAQHAGWIYVHHPHAISQHYNILSWPGQQAYHMALQQQTLLHHRNVGNYTDCDIICDT